MNPEHKELTPKESIGNNNISKTVETNINNKERKPRKRYHKGQQQRRIIQKNQIELEKKTTKKAKEEKQFIQSKQRQSKINPTSNEPWGDDLNYSQLWPGLTEQKTIRILSQNLNGISSFHDFIEWEYILNNMHGKQTDIAGFTEVNLDLNKPKVKMELLERAKKMDQNIKIATSSSKYKNNNEMFKMGGTLTITRGNWSGRITKSGNDKLGRWSYMILTGKNGKKLKVITMYRVCKDNGHAGNCTIRIQQEADILEQEGKLIDPRERILVDLEREISNDHDQGYQIILMGDFNENVTKSKRIQSFLDATNMKNVLERKHGKEQPTTYDRGKLPIDMIAISESLPDESIVACGMLPFYDGNFSDHRALYCDINHSYLFTNSNIDTTKHIHRNFTTEH